MKLTQEDLGAIKGLIEVTIDEKLDLKLDERLKYLPTKDEFYAETAKIYKKMEDIEDSIMIINDRSAENRDRIEALEEIHPGGAHAVA